ncbi:MAG TPA: delta-60 repeat domain-containing protein, partial [Luteolibacter sp.]
MNFSRIFSFLLALMGKATAFRPLFIAFAVLLTVVLPVVAQTPDSFNPDSGDGGIVDCLAVQADGKILVGGDFSTLGEQMRKYFARLNADGSLDSAFNPDANDYVSSFAVQRDGKILVGGRFTVIGGQTRNFLARLNADGSLDAAFNPNANGNVNSIVVQVDGKILIGGDFTGVGGQTRNYVARLNADGSLDTSFNSNSAEGYVWVRTLAVQTDGKIVVGGWFDTFGGQPRNHIARLNANGSLDTAFNPDADNPVSSLVMQADGKILVGGSFSTIGGETRSCLARLNADGSLDTSFSADANLPVDSIAVQADGKILVGGSFTIFSEWDRNHIARLDADGSLDTGFNPKVNSFNPGAYGTVPALAVQADGKVLIGGSFFDIDGQVRRGIARLNNDTVAMSSLAVSGISEISWARGGSAPEVSLVTFECWTGSAWKALGNATRVAGGWRMTGLSLPVRGWVRARGHTSVGSQNGSAGVVEQMAVYGGGVFPDIAVSAE